MVEVKRLVSVVTLATLLVRSVLLSSSDTDISIAGTSDSSDEVTSTMSKTSNSSASVTITIAVTGVPDE
jgi:hypothetical protein